jgi:hypothetical protein
MRENWNSPLGAVTIKSEFGNVWHFPSLKDAILSRRTYFRFCDGFEHEDALLRSPWRYFQKVICFDETGLQVPLWRIEAERQNYLGEIDDLKLSLRKKADYDPEKHFRKGPVPHIHRRRIGRHYRRIKTHAERRDHIGLLAELQDCPEYKNMIKLRGRRKNIPTCWDDIRLSRRGESWKTYRKTRYKERKM